MNSVKLYFAPLLTLIGGLVAVVMLASTMGDGIEQRARALADRAFGEAQTNWQNQARDLVLEASEL